MNNTGKNLKILHVQHLYVCEKTLANKHKFLYVPILSTIINISTDKQVYIFNGNNGYMDM